MSRKIILFGNSGSGKSTLAKRLVHQEGLAHLDLDTLAWSPSVPPERTPLSKSRENIESFVRQNEAWVVEGCYTDLLEIAAETANEAIFMNVDVDQCIANAKSRPWEPHKYASKSAQDDNLDMLIEWIRQYTDREDVFSFQAHSNLFEEFGGKKTMIVGNSDQI